MLGETFRILVALAVAGHARAGCGDANSCGAPQGLLGSAGEAADLGGEDAALVQVKHMGEQENVATEQVATCWPEHVALVRQYIDLLGDGDVKGLTDLFTHDGIVMSTSSGEAKPEEFFSAWIPTLATIATEELEILCSTSPNSSPSISARFKITYQAKGAEEKESGIYVDIFHIATDSSTMSLSLRAVEMHGNAYTREPFLELEGINPSALHGYPFDTEYSLACLPEHVALVREYVTRLGMRDIVGLISLYEPKGFMLSSRRGYILAKDFFNTFLPLLSSAATQEPQIFCKMGPTPTSPVMAAARFNIEYTYIGKDVPDGGIYLDFFRISPRRGSKPSRLQSVEMFENQFLQEASGIKAVSFPQYTYQQWESTTNMHSAKLPLDASPGPTLSPAASLPLRKPPPVGTPQGPDAAAALSEVWSHAGEGSQLEGLPVQCMPDHVAYVRAYVRMLGRRDAKGIASLFGPKGFVVSTSKGVTQAGKFFGPWFATLADAAAQEIEVFCALAARSSLMIASKFKLTFRPKEADTEESYIFVDMFRVDPASGTTPTRLHSVEMYGNSFVTKDLATNPTSAVGPAFGPSHNGTCSQDHIDLVRAYLGFLRKLDAKGVASLFAPNGFMVGSRKGKVEASAYFDFFLSSVSDLVTREIAILCTLNPASNSIAIAVNFEIDYEVLATGKREGGITLDVLYLTTGDATTTPRLLSAEMFDNEYVANFEE